MCIGFNGVIDFLDFEMCEIEKTSELFIHKNSSSIIVLREIRCGVVGSDEDLIQTKRPYLLIFNKYEEIDTNSLNLEEWIKL